MGFTHFWPTPLVNSVLTTVGITQRTSTPLPRSSARTASLRPTTACLVAVQVDVDLAVDRLGALLLERGHRHDPGVVDDGVDRSQLPFGLVEEVGEGGAIGDVERERDGAAAELDRGLLGQLEVEVTDGDAAPLRDQRRGRRLTDPAGTAGDRHDLAAE